MYIDSSLGPHPAVFKNSSSGALGTLGEPRTRGSCLQSTASYLEAISLAHLLVLRDVPDTYIMLQGNVTSVKMEKTSNPGM